LPPLFKLANQRFEIQSTEENLRSKSLRTIVNKYDNLLGWRFSMSPYRDQEWMVNVPLPLVHEWVRAAD